MRLALGGMRAVRLAHEMSLVLLSAVVLSLTLFAQTGTDGSFIGTVLDASGASVPAAEVTVKQLNTGLTKTVSADEVGNFAIAALPIGPYSINVRAKGFKRWEIARVELTVGNRSRVSPVLSVGDVAETVAVEASAEVLQTEKTSVETVVQMRQIRELPLPTRNPLSLVALVPGMRWESTQDGGERAT